MLCSSYKRIFCRSGCEKLTQTCMSVVVRMFTGKHINMSVNKQTKHLCSVQSCRFCNVSQKWSKTQYLIYDCVCMIYYDIYPLHQNVYCCQKSHKLFVVQISYLLVSFIYVQQARDLALSQHSKERACIFMPTKTVHSSYQRLLNRNKPLFNYRVRQSNVKNAQHCIFACDQIFNYFIHMGTPKQ
ncbi:Hypothetical_protein [Hexamita inflata]|uniref:Hypothetical_protein n=1 Tax=Hexamita inflata TaxID=28002 RepID=A0AA86PRN6_9EUKA|nr:Hypothetical protein HINF_LOCUS31258 [Hexamita inflata]